MLAAVPVVRGILGVSVVLSVFPLAVGYSCGALFPSVLACTNLPCVGRAAFGAVWRNSPVLVVSRLCGSCIVLWTSAALLGCNVMPRVACAVVYLGNIGRSAGYATCIWPAGNTVAYTVVPAHFPIGWRTVPLAIIYIPSVVRSCTWACSRVMSRMMVARVESRSV